MKPAKRNLAICLAFCAAVIGVGLARAAYFKSQLSLEFKPSEEVYGRMGLQTAADRSVEDGLSFAESAEELESRSDCVLRVRIRPELELLGLYFLASADVVKVISGEAPPEGAIFISEPVSMQEAPAYYKEHPEWEGQGPIVVYGAANRLRPGDEYVVALRRVELAKGSFYPEHDGRVYIYTDMLCSAFPCGREPVYHKYASDEWNDENPVRYDEVRDADYIGSASVLGSCKALYERMTERFGQEIFD